MIPNSDGTYTIDYDEFCALFNEGGWRLRIRMKEKWDEERHKQYIDCLLNHNDVPKHKPYVQFVVDNGILFEAEIIDVYITFVNNDVDLPSKNKHISFTKL